MTRVMQISKENGRHLGKEQRNKIINYMSLLFNDPLRISACASSSKIFLADAEWERTFHSVQKTPLNIGRRFEKRMESRELSSMT